jgi:AraC family transcriptional regulator
LRRPLSLLLNEDMPNRESSLEEYRSRIERAIAYIQGNLGGEISLEGAAEAACFSKYHFHRIFTAVMGESFADYVRRLRLEKAAYFLEQRPSLSVTEVALAAGFASPSVFSRNFAERFGRPPSLWREGRPKTTRFPSGCSEPNAGTVGQAPELRLWEAQILGTRETDAGDQGTRPFIQKMPALRFASCLHVGPYGPGIHEAWGRLGRWAGPRGLFGRSKDGGEAQAVGISWDNPDICPPERCRYSACIAIPDELEPSGKVVVLCFPARTYLCLHYAGDEEGFAAAYGSLYRRYLPESGFEPEDDPAIEFYHGFERRAKGFDLDIALPVRALR